MSSFAERLERRLHGSRWRIGDHNPGLLAIRLLRRFVDVRVTGLAAEMTYYALVSLVPLLIALGAGMGMLGVLFGRERVAELEDSLVDMLYALFSEAVVTEVMGPLVRELLHEQRTGAAVGSLLVTFWLASRVFRAAIRALDETYEVPERRNLLEQVLLAYALTLGAVVVVLVVLAMVVIGPLLGGGQQLAAWLGADEAFERLWTYARWPLTITSAGAFLTVLYVVGPNVRNRVRDCLPGAVVGTAGIVLVAAGLRLYFVLAGPRAPAAEQGSLTVQAAVATVGAVLAGVLWMWLTSIAVLTGGLVNAELSRSREGPTTPSGSGNSRPPGAPREASER